MERLTIDEIIEHCGRKTGMYEKACDVKYLETAVMGNGIKEYWEHKQVAEYLRKLKEYEDLEEQGRLFKLPCMDKFLESVSNQDFDGRISKVVEILEEKQLYGTINLIKDLKYYLDLSMKEKTSCNCQHNSNPRDNEPCCRCDSRKENREMKIVTVSDLIKILDTEENRYGGATGKPRMLNLSLNGNFAGSVESVKLDGYGDGLITDVTMEITSSKFTTTNADRIRNMSDEEMAERIASSSNFNCADYCDSFTQGCTFNCGKKGREIALKWLQSEAE